MWRHGDDNTSSSSDRIVQLRHCGMKSGTVIASEPDVKNDGAVTDGMEDPGAVRRVECDGFLA